MHSISNLPARRLKRSGIVITGCLLGAVVSGLALYRDIQSVGQDGTGPVLAQLEQGTADVTRKRSTSYVWTKVREGQKLYKKDSIRSGSGGSAVIRLKDGAKLELGESSLVVVDELTELTMGFFRGQIVLRQATGDARITVGQDGKAKVQNIPLRLLKPSLQAVLFSPFQAQAREKREVEFSWELKARSEAKAIPFAGLKIEVSQDQAFTKARGLSFPVQPEMTNLKIPLEPGHYYWRMAASSGVLTEVRQFRVFHALPMVALSPLNDQNVLRWGDGLPVEFRWDLPKIGGFESRRGFPGEHLLEVSSDPDFRQVQLNQSVSVEQGVARVSGIALGERYWRIKSKYGDLVVYSPPQRFTLDQAKKVSVALAFPRAGAEVESSAGMRLTWSSDAGEAIEYEWEMEKTLGSTSTPLVKARARTASGIWKATPGTYRWRVVAFSKNATVGESPWEDFRVLEGKPVELITPKSGETFAFWDQPPKFNLEWSRDSGESAPETLYDLTLSKDSEFKVVLAETKKLRVTSIPVTDLNLKTGIYYWKVSAVKKSGELLNRSKTSWFSFENHPRLRSPTVLEPKEAALYDLSVAEDQPKLSWEKIEDAQAYEVTIYRGPASVASVGNGSVVLRKNVNDTSFEAKGLGEGIYQWTVRAVDPLKRSGEEARRRQFSISFGAVLEPPKAKTREVQ